MTTTMLDTLHLTAVIRSEDDQYVSLCPELASLAAAILQKRREPC